MNLETNLPCPELKFAEGVRKGTPLDAAGDYKIVTFAGEEVAKFLNGKMARFVREETMEQRMGTVQEKPSVPDVKEWHSAELVAAGMRAGDVCPATPVPLYSPATLAQIGKQEQASTPPRSSFKIRAFRQSGRKPMDPCAPVYQLVSGASGIAMEFKRGEVGTGLREIAWLYEKYRIHGKLGRLHAFWKAIDLYLL